MNCMHRKWLSWNRGLGRWRVNVWANNKWDGSWMKRLRLTLCFRHLGKNTFWSRENVFRCFLTLICHLASYRLWNIFQPPLPHQDQPSSYSCSKVMSHGEKKQNKKNSSETHLMGFRGVKPKPVWCGTINFLKNFAHFFFHLLFCSFLS